jgi:UDP-N-acetylglucosamine--N-acetylmuramyl-(pentapeptide) pyrophosphoryl-undecaprenol N-acetylglucosamine transferase
VAELAAAGVPAVLVPLPGAPGDHQTRNAEALVAAGAAVLVPDQDCSGARLAAVLEPLLADPARLAAMGAAARRLARPHAADDLANLVEAAAARKPFTIEDAAAGDGDRAARRHQGGS